nr:MAG TPA: hypothetical protein [Caudoviricetes sp.]
MLFLLYQRDFSIELPVWHFTQLQRVLHLPFPAFAFSHQQQPY